MKLTQRPLADFSILQKYGPIISLVLLFIACAFWKSEYFLKPQNLCDLVNGAVPAMLLAIGMTVVIITAGIDLSVGSMVAMIGVVVFETASKSGVADPAAPYVVLIGCVVLGLLAGLLNGALITFCNIAPFVVTVAGFAAYRSVAKLMVNAGTSNSPSKEGLVHSVTSGIPIAGAPEQGNAPTLFYIVVVVLAIAALVAFLLKRTSTGRRLIATGANEVAAHYSGVNVKRVKMFAYCLMGVLAGLATYVEAGKLGSAVSTNLGEMFELDAIAAVVIGGTSLAGGKGSVWNSIVGVLILQIIGNILILANVSQHLHGVVKGVIILGAVLLQRGASSK